ncbi:MarR family winged helix-turn-helix transcriptional regulator [Desulfitobacterium sp. AusDCA]|uniref:MarR family winged helix-turn-helix transcriptional regulator n=1 Tax=Desulfitobacterium sp. AusDCA TaxID=3240383 RepID=UPI003DA7A6E0
MNEKDKIIEQINTYYDFWFRINDIYRVWAQNHNTNETTVFILYVINTSTPYCTQNEIGNKLFLPKQTVSLALSGLEKKGYILREANPQDRRNKIVKFTEQGAQYANCILDELRTVELEAFSSIPQDQRMAILETFSLLAGSLHKFLLK